MRFRVFAPSLWDPVAVFNTRQPDHLPACARTIPPVVKPALRPPSKPAPHPWPAPGPVPTPPLPAESCGATPRSEERAGRRGTAAGQRYLTSPGVSASMAEPPQAEKGWPPGGVLLRGSGGSRGRSSGNGLASLAVRCGGPRRGAPVTGCRRLAPGGGRWQAGPSRGTAPPHDGRVPPRGERKRRGQDGGGLRAAGWRRRCRVPGGGGPRPSCCGCWRCCCWRARRALGSVPNGGSQCSWWVRGGREGRREAGRGCGGGRSVRVRGGGGRPLPLCSSFLLVEGEGRRRRGRAAARPVGRSADRPGPSLLGPRLCGAWPHPALVGGRRARLPPRCRGPLPGLSPFRQVGGGDSGEKAVAGNGLGGRRRERGPCEVRGEGGRLPRLGPGLGGACAGRGRPAGPLTRCGWAGGPPPSGCPVARRRESWAPETANRERRGALGRWGDSQRFCYTAGVRSCVEESKKAVLPRVKLAFARLWKGVMHTSSWAAGTKLKDHGQHSCGFLEQIFFFLLDSSDLLISKKVPIISTNVDEVDSVLQNKKPQASQAIFKRRLKGWWSMTGKSSKAGSWFGIHFHCCVDLKLGEEDGVYLSLVTLRPLISFPFFMPLQGKKFNFGKILFSNTTIFLRCKWLWDSNLFSLLFDIPPTLTFGTRNTIKCLTSLFAVTANLVLDESHSSDIVGCVNRLAASQLWSV